MTRSPDTESMWEEAAREARAEVIANQRVVSLRSEISDLSLMPDQRRTIVQQSLERAVMQLEILGDDIGDADIIARLDEIETRLTRRRFALRMRLGLVHLSGMFGRAL
jgi:hypothetical protein